jgi:hypothetical protein
MLFDERGVYLSLAIVKIEAFLSIPTEIQMIAKKTGPLKSCIRRYVDSKGS